MRKLFIILGLLVSVLALGQRFSFPNSAHLSSYPSVIDDGNTVAWFIASDSVVMNPVDSAVRRWGDYLNSGIGAEVVADTSMPKWMGETVEGKGNSILFDGANDYLSTGEIVWGDPLTIYLVARQVTWTINEKLLSGVGNVVYLDQRSDSPQVRFYTGGGYSSNSSDWILNTYDILTVVINGESSFLQVGNNEALSFTSSYDMDGIVIGSFYSLTSFGNIEVKEIICRDVADSESTRTVIIRGLQNKYGL